MNCKKNIQYDIMVAIHKHVSAMDNILCYIKPGYLPENWKTALPQTLKPTMLNDRTFW